MKRAFLFGFGSFLILVIIGLLVRHDTPSVIMALVLMPVSVTAIRAAMVMHQCRGARHNGRFYEDRRARIYSLTSGIPAILWYTVAVGTFIKMDDAALTAD